MIDGSTAVSGTLVPSNITSLLQATFAPFVFGANLGLSWAMSAAPATLRRAAEHATTNEQLQEHLRFSEESLAEGEPDDGNLKLFGPCDDGPIERVNFFKSVRAEYIAFQGDAGSDDDAISRKDVEMGSYSLTDIPVAAFRSFEDGWAAAVRERYKFVSV